MNYEIIPTKTFKRSFKVLSKKYQSLKDDLEIFEQELLENPEIGDCLGNNTRKVRMPIASKNKGKSGGARIITYTIVMDVVDAEIYLLTIYDKSRQDSITQKEIEQLKLTNNLL